MRQVPRVLVPQSHNGRVHKTLGGYELMKAIYCELCVTALEEDVPGRLTTNELATLMALSYMLPDHLCERTEDEDILCDCEAH